MDNGSNHNKRPKGTPKSSTRKGEMQNWLLKNNIDFDPKALKKDLWLIIQHQLKNFPVYDLDVMIKQHRPDITIERLPPYHCELNPIEMV